MATVAARVLLYELVLTHRTTWFVVEVVSERGAVGTGECSDAPLPSELACELDAVFDRIGGRDLVADLEIVDADLWAWSNEPADPRRQFTRRTLMGGVMAAICDLVSQMQQVPLWEFLGGTPPAEVKLYGNINRAPVHRRPEEFSHAARAAARDGFDAVKIAPFDGPLLAGRSLSETGIEHLRAVRDAIGDDCDLLVDVHHRLSMDALVDVLPALDELRVAWLEDAVDLDRAEDLARFASLTDIPLAGGEHIVDAERLNDVLEIGYLRFLLLDPKYVGGPLRLRALLRDVSGVELTYHNPTGPIGTAAAAHLSALHEDFALLEFPFGEDLDRASITVPPETRMGPFLRLSSGSGLGVRLDRDGLATTCRTFEVSVCGG